MPHLRVEYMNGTGEAVSISASTSPTFKAGKTLKDAVNAGAGT
ncbi:MAG: hypothetical protein F4160_00985 [Rhodospirillaceae bacterium]|nr:hypothetical protein [Rhodospirillaceae bacterium]MYF86062.1 hypothetical protein [Rhodospirillaceae bacterium]MYH35357.1 hypothetical protein [Rhodospirillaceae bacterium]MYK15586.1 hypothetical protein [Rhodospirillaceae bacterium]